MLIAGLTLGLGMFAVFGAILYKITATGNRPAPPVATADAAPRAVAASLPAGARLVSTALDGERIALTYEVEDGTLVLVVDLRSGVVISKLTVGR
ncbi:hypothetical protein BH10PSE9_BH10PSE9_07880 [soil metagenome]